MKAARPLLLSCVLVLVLAHNTQPTTTLAPRGIGDIFGQDSSTATTATETKTSDTTTTTSDTTTTTTDKTTTSDTTTTTTSPTTQPTDSTTSTTATTPTTDNQPSTPPPSNTTPSQPSQTEFTTHDETGGIVTITSTVPNGQQSATGTQPSASSTESSAPSSKGLSTGSIVGMSVAAGVAVIGIVGFLVWKFTRKRFSDFDDNEAIKWPELNGHSDNTDANGFPLPTNPTGRHGVMNDSEVSLSRSPSNSTYGGRFGNDPYAVPPLPSMNPGQPMAYRDDPNAQYQQAYYDPYRGPVPNTFNDAASEAGGEAIPMAAMAGRRSPGPGMAYDMGGRGSPAPGRMSPGPGMAYDATGRGSPAPGGGMASGRMSPGPGMAYDAGGRMSPGPQSPYAPPPPMAEHRTMSPGPTPLR